MNLTDKGFLDRLLDIFKEKCVAGIDLLTPEVFYLLIALGTIEIAMGAMLNHDGDKFQVFIKKILKIGFFWYLIENWKDVAIDQVFETFNLAGAMAAGASVGDIIKPSEILSKGLEISAGVLGDIVGVSGKNLLAIAGIILLKIILVIFVLGAFGFMAIQLFLATVEFYIMTTVSLILLPFGVNKHLGFLSEKAIGSVFSSGIKVMTLQFVLGIGWVLAKDWSSINTGDDIGMLAQAGIGACALAFITIKGPDLAQGLMSGSPSLSGGEALNMGKQAAGTALGAATGGASTAVQMAGAVMQATKSTDGKTGMANLAGNLGKMGLNTLQKHSPYTQGRLQAREAFIYDQKYLSDLASNQYNSVTDKPSK